MNKGLWYFMLFILMAVWGLNVVAIKFLVQDLPPITMQSLRVFLAGTVLFIILLITKKLRKLTKKELFYVGISGFFGVLGHHAFLAVGLVRTSASNGSLILALVPLVTSLLAVIFLGDKLTLLRLVGIILGFAGVTFIVLQGNKQISGITIGDFYVLGAVFTQAISIIFIKKGTETMDSILMTSMMFFFGSFLMFILSQFLEPNRLIEMNSSSKWIWFIFLASAIIATGLGHLVNNAAIHILGAGETSIFINITPFFSLLGSALFLGEMIYSSQVIGFILIVVGVIFGTGTIDNYRQRLKAREHLAINKGI